MLEARGPASPLAEVLIGISTMRASPFWPDRSTRKTIRDGRA